MRDPCLATTTVQVVFRLNVQGDRRCNLLPQPPDILWMVAGIISMIDAMGTYSM
jgi:hypothetical protein